MQWPVNLPKPPPAYLSTPVPAEPTSEGASNNPKSSAQSETSSSSSSSCSAVTVTDLNVYCFNTTISGDVYTTDCSTTSSFTTTGCSLTPTTTTTTESATCSAVTVTDVGVGCFNITVSGGGYTTTCNQTSTYVTTGCSLTPTTSTTTDDGPVCSLSPNYDDPAILSDLSSWLAQFPLTLPPDTVNISIPTTTPNATLPKSSTTKGWTTQEILTTRTSETNPATTQSEVVSEVVALWGGTTTIINGSVTEYLGATLTSTLAEATLSTLQSSTVTTVTYLQTTVSGGQDVVISEVLIIYNATSYYRTGAVTEILGGVTTTSVDQIFTITPSDSFATTTTDTYGDVWSKSEDIIGGSTVIVTQSVISTINADTFTPSNFGGPSASVASVASVASISSLKDTIGLPRASSVSIAGGKCAPQAGHTTKSLPDSTSCETFVPAAPTKKPNNQFLNCALNTDPTKLNYETVNYDLPINGTYWLNRDVLWPLTDQTQSPTGTFCALVFGPGSPYIVGPSGGNNPDGAEQPVQLVYVNSIHKSWAGEGNVVGKGDESLKSVFLTFSLTYDPVACGDNSRPAVALSEISSDYCFNTFKRIKQCHSDPNVDMANGNYIPSPGGSFWDSCLIWSVAAKVDYPCDCPRQLNILLQ